MTVANQLLKKHLLNNAYFAMRHGNSMANQMKIISSDPVISTVQHGLSDLGHEQAEKAASDFVRRFQETSQIRGEGVAIFSSDFTRARETAEHVARACEEADIPLFVDGNETYDKNESELPLLIPPSDVVPSKLLTVNVDPRLRERFFGAFNGESDDNYNRVWENDAVSADHTSWDVESVNSVMRRTSHLVLDLESKVLHSNDVSKWNCLLVAHGDVLQIMQTAFCKIDGTKHRGLPHLDTAAIRALELARK